MADGETILATLIMAALPGCMYLNQPGTLVENERKVRTILNRVEQAFFFFAILACAFGKTLQNH